MKHRKFTLTLFILLSVLFLGFFTVKSLYSDLNDSHDPKDSNKVFIVLDINDINDSIIMVNNLTMLDSLDNLLINIDSIVNFTLMKSLDSLEFKLENISDEFDFHDIDIKIEAIKDSVENKKVKFFISRELIDEFENSVYLDEHFMDSIKSHVHFDKESFKHFQDSLKVTLDIHKEHMKIMKDSLKNMQKDIILKVKTETDNIKSNKGKMQNFKKMSDSEIKEYFKQNDPDLTDEDIKIEREGEDIKIIIKKEN